jgi:hypothetical protein
MPSMRSQAVSHAAGSLPVAPKGPAAPMRPATTAQVAGRIPPDSVRLAEMDSVGLVHVALLGQVLGTGLGVEKSPAWHMASLLGLTM